MSPSLDILQGHRMSDGEIETLLLERGVGVLSMANDGVPYAVPISFGYDGDDHIYLLFAGHSEEGRKVIYAERSETASFLVYDTESGEDWWSVIVEGSLDRITIDSWEAARQAMADNAYRADLLTNVDRWEDPRVWAIDIDTWSGRTSDGQ